MRGALVCPEHGRFSEESLDCPRCEDGRAFYEIDADDEPVRVREVEAHRIAARDMDADSLARTVRVLGSLRGDSTHTAVWLGYRDELARRTVPALAA